MLTYCAIVSVSATSERVNKLRTSARTAQTTINSLDLKTEISIRFVSIFTLPPCSKG